MCARIAGVGIKIFYGLPWFLHFIRWPVDFAVWLAEILRIDQWLLQGKELSSEKELTILFSGSEENKNFIAQTAFGDHYYEKYNGKTSIWRRVQFANAKIGDWGLIITEVSKIFSLIWPEKKCFYLPSWVDGYVNVDSMVRSDSMNTDLRRIRKNSLSFEVTNDPEQFRNFYYNMHRPYVQKAFGKTAVIFSYEHMAGEFGKNGQYNDLLLVKKGEDYIGGMLLGYSKDEIYLHPLGIKDGNFDYVKDGAIGALFYFPIIYAKEQGYKRVNFGLSRPFLRNGVFEFKRRRGMHLAGTSGKGFILRMRNTDGTKGFLLNNPFIRMDKRRFKETYFIDGLALSDSPNNIDKIYKDSYTEGISELSLYLFGKKENMPAAIPDALADKVKIHPAQNLFVQKNNARKIEG
jgi:hypothetical protein